MGQIPMTLRQSLHLWGRDTSPNTELLCRDIRTCGYLGDARVPAMSATLPDIFPR